MLAYHGKGCRLTGGPADSAAQRLWLVDWDPGRTVKPCALRWHASAPGGACADTRQMWVGALLSTAPTVDHSPCTHCRPGEACPQAQLQPQLGGVTHPHQ